jgi:hypothetical protein
MAAIADSGAIYGLYNRRGRYPSGAAVRDPPRARRHPDLAAILSEIEYLIAARLGAPSRNWIS